MTTARIPRRTPIQQAQAAAPLRRAQRAPVAAQREHAQRETMVSTHQGRSTVSENVRNETVAAVAVDPNERAEVKVTHGKTISLGNFEFLRIDVAVTYPCTVGTIQDAIETAHDHVVAGIEREESYMLGSAPAPRRANRRG